MSESTIRELLRSTENMISERFRMLEDVLRLRSGVADTTAPVSQMTEEQVSSLTNFKDGFMSVTLPGILQTFKGVNERLDRMEENLRSLARTAAVEPSPLLPTHPLEGLEVIPKREVVVESAPVPPTESISKEDRLLLNRAARKALEAEEMGESRITDHPEMVEEEVADSEDEKDVVMSTAEPEEEAEGDVEMVEAEEEAEEAEADEEEAEADEEEAEEEADEEEAEEEALEEFEYRGGTYYRDSELNVYRVDDDGELVSEPIGIWNEAKQRIVVKKPAA
jgi:chemotaxis protein histidine kinase CheA